MRPLHINLAVLLILVVAAWLVFLTVGQGALLQSIEVLLSAGWSVQLVTMGWSALFQAPLPYFTSKRIFSLWIAAAFPLLCAQLPNVPVWFALASAPLGGLMAYTMISALLWMLGVQAKLLARLRNS